MPDPQPPPKMAASQSAPLRPRRGLRAVLANISWLSVEKALRIAAAVVIGSWVARHLGPETFGVLGGVMAVVALLGPFTTCGLEQLVTRSLVANPECAERLVWRAFRIRIVCASAAYAFLIVWWWVWGERTPVVPLVGILLFVQAADVFGYFFQAKTLSKYNAIASMWALGIASAARVLGILSDAGLLWFAALIWAQPLIRQGVTFYYIRKRTERGNAAPPPSAEVWPWSQRIPVIVALFGALVFNKIDILMLKSMHGDAEAGRYFAAARLTETFQILPSIVAISLFPALMRSWTRSDIELTDRLRRYYQFNAFCSYVIVGTLFAVADLLVWLLYGNEFEASSAILRIHVFSLFASFLASVRYQYIVAEKLMGYWMLIALAGAIANVVLNLLLIPEMAGRGAALATAISYSFSAVVMSFFHPRLIAQGKMQLRSLVTPLGFLSSRP